MGGVNYSYMYNDKFLISPRKSSLSSFTLVELIIVIIIVGILAAVGISQYSKMVEKSRGAEARMILGQMRALVYQYRLENGSITSISNADLNIGTASDQLPSYSVGCRSTHYFAYAVGVTNPQARLWAMRCTSGGKNPNFSGLAYLGLIVDTASGQDYWTTNGVPWGQPGVSEIGY